MYDKAAYNVHTNNIGPAFFWKNNLVDLEFMLVGHHKWQEDRRANDSAKQTKNKNPACLVQNQLQCVLVFFVALISLWVFFPVYKLCHF